MSKKQLKEIKEMLKLIPNNFPVCLEDLEEIFNKKIN